MLRKLDERLFLIGVAHVLPRSASEVKEVILREKPEVVAVELCPTRYMTLMGGLERPSALEILRAGRIRLFILNALLYLLQSKFARQTGMPAGEEMMTAIRHAQEIGAKVKLIDQNIEITLQRLVDCMPWRERMRLFAELLLGILPLGAHVKLERLTEDQIVSHLLYELRRVSPTSYRVLIEERDAYMASRIAMLLSEGFSRMVCVLGAGHVPGVHERLSKSLSGSWGMTIEYGLGD